MWQMTIILKSVQVLTPPEVAHRSREWGGATRSSWEPRGSVASAPFAVRLTVCALELITTTPSAMWRMNITIFFRPIDCCALSCKTGARPFGKCRSRPCFLSWPTGPWPEARSTRTSWTPCWPTWKPLSKIRCDFLAAVIARWRRLNDAAAMTRELLARKRTRKFFLHFFAPGRRCKKKRQVFVDVARLCLKVAPWSLTCWPRGHFVNPREFFVEPRHVWTSRNMQSIVSSQSDETIVFFA